ncbi:biotin transporter BioY [Schinkia azotoformans]|uniref:Biotin transporter n=1 Tax=Schinkia azotoformans LMG 9581 TaxID=1131731 RepID=K6D4G4_SCHAZ|nr:biotin transporter BioY [Schinkia azotoformans]EKN63164.1 BioY protein [Schinkia azotoformans LMG 9581]MEC1637286.1 biotin transporter BioY [Schinkia azotoformans]MEC1943690.1 biotin transporter BioY [Schinkia azotoformans]
MKRFRTIDLTMVGVFVALMAIGANTASFLVIGGVPITLQTFFAILAGAILGSRIGALAMIVYTLVGIAGAPVFAQFTGGAAILIKPTFGFILSYILVAYVIGKIIENGQKPTMRRFITASLIGMVINYVIGTNWMYYAYKLWADAPDGFSYAMAWGWMMVPLPKDIILSVLAGAMSPRIYAVVQKSNPLAKETVAE